MIKISIAEMQGLAKSKGGRCLSDTYENAHTKLLWECAEGHQWMSEPNSIKQGTWCDICSRKTRYSKQRLIRLKEMHNIAESRGGKCLSDSYVNGVTKLLWECRDGHRWEAVPNSIKSGTWCPYCGGTKKLSIEEMKSIAKKRGGKCLSDVYVNAHTKLLWECADGHRWEAIPDIIRRGSWCGVCCKYKNYPESRKKKLDLMRELASKQGGKCLSPNYTSARTKLLWECSEGHQWKAEPNNVKRGRWCKKCAIDAIRGSLEAMKRIAIERGGKCLSDTYINTHSKLSWECAKGHRWEAMPFNIKRGQWCPVCAGRKKLTIEEMKIIATARGGKCLSNSYKRAQSHLLWECSEGHRWKAVPMSIRRGTWCPECSVGLGERICRAFFEQLFKKRFPTSYPKWLVSKKGYQMELDGYCKSMGLAFEHHGEQHYSTHVKHMIASNEVLKIRQEADRHKRELCKTNGVILIEIPQIMYKLPLSEVKGFIKKECIRKGISLPRDYDNIEVDLKDAYSSPSAKDALIVLIKIAESRGGMCLSDTYMTATSKLLWECAKGHRWEAVPNSIKRGTWCPYCGGTKKLTIEAMRNRAEEKGGKCLSKKYINSGTPLLWECDRGHQWKAAWDNIKQGSWCPECAGIIKLTLDEMKKTASKRGGQCLSKKYVNSATKLKWKCKQGHTWEATPEAIKRGTWCPYCGGNKKLTIEEMKKIAKERGGKCLSDVYVNAHTKLLWECAKGHRWEAMPTNIKSGKWCPACARDALRRG